jgi:hypothetical protein
MERLRKLCRRAGFGIAIQFHFVVGCLIPTRRRLMEGRKTYKAQPAAHVRSAAQGPDLANSS